MGVSFKEWYPNWVNSGSYCSNDGNQPPFMKDSSNSGGYLFKTQKECCDTWYSYADECTGSSGDPTTMKFYPVYLSNGCSSKPGNEFESWEQERYDTLEACCADKFNYQKGVCCDSPGMGGCTTSGKVVFVPDWENSKCTPRSEETLSDHDKIYAKSSRRSCCDAYFEWSRGSWYNRGNSCYESAS